MCKTFTIMKYGKREYKNFSNNDLGRTIKQLQFLSCKYQRHQ